MGNTDKTAKNSNMARLKKLQLFSALAFADDRYLKKRSFLFFLGKLFFFVKNVFSGNFGVIL